MSVLQINQQRRKKRKTNKEPLERAGKKGIRLCVQISWNIYIQDKKGILYTLNINMIFPQHRASVTYVFVYAKLPC